MKAKTIKGKSTEEIQAALQKSMSDGFSPTLAIIFLSVSQDRNAICRLLDGASIAVFGSTTNGEFIDEETESKSVAVLLLDMKKESFRIYAEEFQSHNYRDVSKTVAQNANREFEKVAFLLATSNAATDGEEVLMGLQKIAGTQVNAFGGAAGDDYAFEETWVFTNKWESNNGMICIAVDEEKVMVNGIATCGWKAVGTEKTVTKSEGNHVYTIDGVPALDITTKYGGLENVTPENKDLLMELAGNFPSAAAKGKRRPCDASRFGGGLGRPLFLHKRHRTARFKSTFFTATRLGCNGESGQRCSKPQRYCNAGSRCVGGVQLCRSNNLLWSYDER